MSEIRKLDLACADLPPPGGHYSHATSANGFVFVSGQLPVRPNGERLIDAPFATQASQALANVAAALQQMDSDISRLVQVRVYVDDIGNWPQFDSIYSAWAGASRPARAVVPTGPLHHGFKIEIEAIALVALARVAKTQQ
jgi:reactive intermediate/imine deaminase